MSAAGDAAATRKESSPDDLSRLQGLDEASVRDAVYDRFQDSKIYTHVNSLLIAVNPYRTLDIYGQEMLEAYSGYGQAAPGPHVFGVAASSYRGLMDSRSQSVVISGESGTSTYFLLSLPHLQYQQHIVIPAHTKLYASSRLAGTASAATLTLAWYANINCMHEEIDLWRTTFNSV